MADTMKIAVLGGGNSAQTMAADLVLEGASVNLCDLPEFESSIAHVMKTGAIEKYGSTGSTGKTGHAPLNKVTTSIADAIDGVEIVFLAVPAYGHMTFYEALADCLQDGQTVVTIPGCWGALRLSRLLKQRGSTKRITVAETSQCVHVCRVAEPWLGPGKVRVIAERKSFQIAAIPAKETDSVRELVASLYPQVKSATNVLETSLNNGNFIVHAPMVIMNAGWIEHTNGDFMFYRDGATRSIGGVIDAIAAERDTISAKLGFTPMPAAPYIDRMKDVEWVNDPCETAPPSLQHRYVSEDVPYGLVPIAGFGDLLDVPTPAADSMIVLSSISNESDYWKEGLTLEKLGFGGLSAQEILEIANKGY